MSPTFDFNAFINSASPPSSPAAALLRDSLAKKGKDGDPPAQVGADSSTKDSIGAFDANNVPGAGQMKPSVSAGGFPVFDPGQPSEGDGGGGNDGNDGEDSTLPAWATASELGQHFDRNLGDLSRQRGSVPASASMVSSQHSYSGSGAATTHNPGSSASANLNVSASGQQQAQPSTTGPNMDSSARHGMMDAMLFSTASMNDMMGMDMGSVNMPLDMSMNMGPPFFGMGGGLMGAAGSGMNMMGLGGFDMGMIGMDGVGMSADLPQAPGAAEGPAGMIVRRHTTDASSVLNANPGGLNGSFWLPQQQQPQQGSQQQQQVVWGPGGNVPQHFVPGDRIAGSAMPSGPPPSAPLPQHQTLQTAVQSEAAAKVGPSGAQAQIEEDIANAQGQAERDYRARIAAHHISYLQSKNTGSEGKGDGAAATASASSPKDASKKSSKKSSKSKEDSSSGNSTAQDSVTARVMSWAAGTGGPAAGSGASSEGTNSTSNSTGPATGVPTGNAGGISRPGLAAPKGTYAHRLSLQERRRLSRLALEGEGTGSDSGGSGGQPNSRSQSQSQSEASGTGVMQKKVPESGAGLTAGASTLDSKNSLRVMPERTKRSLAAGQAAADAAAEQDSHSSNYNGSKSKSASSGDDEEVSKSTGSGSGLDSTSSARAVRESSGEGTNTDMDPVFHGPYHDIAVSANAKGGPKHIRNSYSSSGFDILGALTKVATRKNPRIQLGPIDLSCAFTVADALTPDHPLIYVSETFTRLTGYQPADVLGKNCRFLQAPDGNVAKGADRLNTDGRAVAHIKKHMDRMRECQASLINYKKNGKAFINLVTIVPIPWGDSNVIQYFVGFQVDLVEQPGAILEKDANGQYVVNYTTTTRRVTAPSAPPPPPDPVKEALEEKHRQVSGAHKLAETVASGQADVRPWARLLLDNAQDLIYVLSLKGIFLYVSPSVERILGYKAEELIGRSISDFCHPSDVVPVFRELKDSTSNANIAAAARRSVKALGGYKALTKGGAGQSGPQVNLLLRMRHKNLGHQWIESIGKLHLEQGKGRKVVISSGRPRMVYNLNWDQVRRTTDDREPAFWTKVSLDGLVLSSTTRTAAVLGCTPAALAGQHLAEMSNGEAVPSLLQALRSRSVSMVSHMLHDTVGQGEPVAVLSTFYPSVEQAIALGSGAGGELNKSGGASDALPSDVAMASEGDANPQHAGSKPSSSSYQPARGPSCDSTASVFVHIRRATSEMPLEANIAYMDDLQLLKMQAQLRPGTLHVLPTPATANVAVAAAATSAAIAGKPLTVDMPGEAGALAAATVAAAADLGGAGSVFTELSTYRSSSWVFELQQLKIMNKKLREEVKLAQRRGQPGAGAGQQQQQQAQQSQQQQGQRGGGPLGQDANQGSGVPSTPLPQLGHVSTPSTGGPPHGPSQQQMFAHQQQMAAQAQALAHHPAHMNSIVGGAGLHGNGSFHQHSFSGVPMTLNPSSSSSSALGQGPTSQSPAASRVLPPNGGIGAGMSGHANALAAAGVRRPGIVPIQSHHQHSFQLHHQHQHPHHPAALGQGPSSSGGMHHAMPMSMSASLGRDGSMSSASMSGLLGASMGGVSMAPSSSSGTGTGSQQLFDVFAAAAAQQQQHHGRLHAQHLPSHHHLIGAGHHHGGGSGGPGYDSTSSGGGSGGQASGETSSTAATSLESTSTSSGGLGVGDDGGAAAAAAAAGKMGSHFAGRKRSAAGDILPSPNGLGV